MKIRSVRILDTMVCSGSLVWLFSPAWDAVKLTLPGGWLHLSFRGHRPYRFRSDDCICSELAPGLMFDYFLPIPDAESLPFYSLVLKLVVCVTVCGSHMGATPSGTTENLHFLPISCPKQIRRIPLVPALGVTSFRLGPTL